MTEVVCLRCRDGHPYMELISWLLSFQNPLHWDNKGILMKLSVLHSKHGISSVQSPSRVWLFATPWTAARQASLSITNSRSPPKPMSIESVMPFNHLLLWHPLLFLPSIFPSTGSFQMSQFFTSGGQSTGVSASASVLPMNIQDWFP